MENLHETCFAYPGMRKYPIITKEAALKSFKAFKQEQNLYNTALCDVIKQNFEKAASFHNINLEELTKEASTPVEEDTIIFTTPNGELSFTKIASSEDIEQAADYIIEKRASLPRVDLQEPAKYILWSAANSDIDINTDKMRKIARIAGIGVGNREEIEHEFDKRATLLNLPEKEANSFWNWSKELKSLSDEDFYKEANLNAVCNVIDGIDFRYNNEHRHATDLKYPEDVIFSQNIDDLQKEASDLLLIPEIDTTISKKALLERKDAVKEFFKQAFSIDLASDEELLEKTASLDRISANALLDKIE